jgi:hypothetical protein
MLVAMAKKPGTEFKIGRIEFFVDHCGDLQIVNGDEAVSLTVEELRACLEWYDQEEPQPTFKICQCQSSICKCFLPWKDDR